MNFVVGCAQKVYVKDGQVIQIEGNPDIPVSRGRLCPKGSATKQLVTGPQRLTKVRYRAPYATDWREIDLDTAMDMVVDRVLDAGEKGWQDFDKDRNTLRPDDGGGRPGVRDGPDIAASGGKPCGASGLDAIPLGTSRTCRR